MNKLKELKEKLDGLCRKENMEQINLQTHSDKDYKREKKRELKDINWEIRKTMFDIIKLYEEGKNND